MYKSAYKTIFVHVLLWLLFFGVIAYGFTITLDTIITTAQGTTKTNFTLLPVRLELYGMLFKVSFFYSGIFYLFPRFFKKKLKFVFFIAFTTSIFLFYILETFLLRSFVLGDMFSRNIFTTKSYTYYLYRVNPLMYFILAILTFIYFFIAEWMQHEKTKNMVKQEQLKTELSLLKYQINPHFLFNTLNNFYSIAQQHNVGTLESGILKLSKMMRYNLYESNQDTVHLNKEIDYINNYISIYKYKFDEKDNFDLTFVVRGETGNKHIVPFLFLPLVENALKHGFQYNKKSFVRVAIHIHTDFLEIDVSNTFHPDYKVLKDSSGIGLANIKKRLALIYPDTHKFETRENDNIFYAYLKVPLHEYQDHYSG
ncbi:MAG: histidine kinase [Chitinophagaceae bacterium]